MEKRTPNTATHKCYACRKEVLDTQMVRLQGMSAQGGKHDYCPDCAKIIRRGIR